MRTHSHSFHPYCEAMFTYEGINRVSGTMVSLYEVHFYNNAGALKTIWVDTELLGGGDYYDHPVNGVLWVALAEKAYLEANSFGCVTTAQPGVDSYAALAIGKPMWALQGHHRTTGDRLQHRPHDIASVWNAGDLIVLGTPDTETDSHIMVIHAHAVVGYNASGTMPSQLYNPCARSPTGTPLATRASLGGAYSAPTHPFCQSASSGRPSGPCDPDCRSRRSTVYPESATPPLAAWTRSLERNALVINRRSGQCNKGAQGP